jgi:ABC-2 type transport system permease protein
MTTPAAAGTVPWVHSLRTLALLGFRLAFQGKRALFVSLFLAGPVLIAIALRYVIPNVPRALASSDELIVNFALLGYGQFLVPFVALLFGTSVVSEEWDDKTLTYLFTRPVPKAAVAIGKGIGVAVMSMVLVGLSFGLTTAVIASRSVSSDFVKHPMEAPHLMGILLLATLPYTALFAFFGAVLRRPLIPGLVFIFVEKFLAWVPLSLQPLAFFHYVRALILPYADVSSAVREMERHILASAARPTPGAAVAWLVGFTVVFGALAAYAVSRREFLLTKE